MMEYDQTVKSSCHMVDIVEESKSHTLGSISISMKGLLDKAKMGSPKEMLIVERNGQGEEESSDGEPTGDSFVQGM